jgi:mono/diheme cytochrome c family protein
MRLLPLLLLALPAATALAEGAPDPKPLFAKRCAGCHGEDGRAHTKPGKKLNIADFTEKGWVDEWTPAKVSKVIAEGIPQKMPSFASKLSPAEVQAVADHVFVLAKPAAAPTAAPAAPAKPETKP